MKLRDIAVIGVVKGWESEETWQDFKKNIPNGTIDDYNKILYEQDPWPLNVKPSFKILKGGDTFEMAMAPRSKQLDTWPGNFATDIKYNIGQTIC